MRTTPRILGALAAAGAVVVAGVDASAQDRAHNQPQDRDRPVRATMMRVEAPGGMTGSNVVRTGIPLPPDSGVTDTSSLGIWRASSVHDPDARAVSAQWRVLSRWGGVKTDTTKPIRWVFADFRADGGTSYVLRTGPGANGHTASTPVAVEDKSGVTVDTGVIRFRVPADRFAPLAGLSAVTRDADGREHMVQLVRDEGVNVRTVNAEILADGSIVDFGYALGDNAPRRVSVEENGPLRAVVKIEGNWKDPQGRPLLEEMAEYTLRIVAEAGSAAVKMSFTIENNGLYGPPAEHSIDRSKAKWLFLRNLDVTVPTLITGGFHAAMSNHAWNVTPTPDMPDFRVLQLHEVRNPKLEMDNFRFTVTGRTAETEAYRELTHGDRTDGGVVVTDGHRSLFADTRYFWQQYPTAISFDAGVLKYELLPRQENQRWPPDLHKDFGDAYQLEGGRHKTYEMMLAFPGATAATAQGDCRNWERSFQNPPRVVLDPDWVMNSRVVGDLPAPRFKVGNVELTYAQAHFERMLKGLVDVSYDDAQGAAGEIAPASLIEMRETRGNAMPASFYDLDCYGFMNFGDLPHHGGFCSGHYDWIRGLFMNYLRFGKAEFFDVGVEMTRHRYDIDQYHGKERVDPNWSWFNGFQRFHMGHHGAFLSKYHPNGEWTPTPDRTALEGLLLAYALTGDERAFEAARENAEAFVNYFTNGSRVLGGFAKTPLEYYGELSSMSSAVEQLVAYYEFTGEERYYEFAYRIFVEGLLFLEEFYGNTGSFHIKEKKQEIFPMVRLLRPLMRIHEISGDDRALALLLRMLGWLKEEGYALSGDVERTPRRWYIPLQLPYFFERRNTERAGEEWEIPYNFMTADAYAYAYRHTGEVEFLLFARQLFRDSVLFYQAPQRRPVPPDFYSHVSYAPRQYPGAETKPGAWMLGGHMTYLFTEQQIAVANRGGPVDIPFPGHVGAYATRTSPVPYTGTGPVRLKAIDTPPPQLPRPVRVDPPKVPVVRPPVRPPVPPPPVVRPPVTRPPVTRPPVPVPPRPKPPVVVRPPRRPAPTPTNGGSMRPPATAGEIVLDDGDAVLEGRWTLQKENSAHGNEQHVAPSLTRNAVATYTAPITVSGTYRLYGWWGSVTSAAANSRWEVRHADGVEVLRVNQAAVSGRWRLLGQYQFTTKQPMMVRITNLGANGSVVADAIKLVPVR